MKLMPDETDYILYYAEHKKLYMFNSYFELLKGYNIIDTNEILFSAKLLPPLGNFDWTQHKKALAETLITFAEKIFC